MSSEFVMHSMSMISSSAKHLFDVFESPLSVRKYDQILFVSLDLLSMLIDLRFKSLINCLVLFR